MEGGAVHNSIVKSSEVGSGSGSNASGGTHKWLDGGRWGLSMVNPQVFFF
jgi:hypothetical protein